MEDWFGLVSFYGISEWLNNITAEQTMNLTET